MPPLKLHTLWEFMVDKYWGVLVWDPTMSQWHYVFMTSLITHTYMFMKQTFIYNIHIIYTTIKTKYSNLFDMWTNTMCIYIKKYTNKQNESYIYILWGILGLCNDPNHQYIGFAKKKNKNHGFSKQIPHLPTVEAESVRLGILIRPELW